VASDSHIAAAATEQRHRREEKREEPSCFVGGDERRADKSVRKESGVLEGLSRLVVWSLLPDLIKPHNCYRTGARGGHSVTLERAQARVRNWALKML
jgi:hypothetical protein